METETEKLDVIELGSEFDDTEPDPEHAHLEIASFADSLAFGYKNTTVYFDVAAPSEEINEFIRLFKKLFVRAVVRREVGDSMVKQLPKVRLGKKEYYYDERLREIRSVDNPHDRVTKDELIAVVNEIYNPVMEAMVNEGDSLEGMVNLLNAKGVTSRKIREMLSKRISMR